MAKANKSSSESVISFYKIASLVMTKVGTAGFICISIIAYVFFYVPQNLKDELTNTWLLYKCADCNYIYISLILVLSVLFFVQSIVYRKVLKMKNDRIKEITKERSELQEKLLNKKLKTSSDD